MPDDRPPHLVGSRIRSGRRWSVLAIVAVLAGAGALILAVASESEKMPAGDSPVTEVGGASASASPSPAVSSLPAPSAVPDPNVRPSKNPVPLGDASEVTPGLRVAITNIEAVQGEARGPGEIAAPSLRLTLTVTNESAITWDLSTAVTNAYFGRESSPAQQLTEPGAVPLPPSVDAGTEVTGVFVFSIPEDQRGSIRVEFDYSTGVPVTVFEGPVP